MKYLIPLLLLFVACSNSTEPEPEQPEVFEPYQIGSWLMTSPDSADWVGNDFSLKTANDDTMYFTSPENNSLTLRRDTTFTDEFILAYTDSTISAADSININLTYYTFHASRNDAVSIVGSEQGCCGNGFSFALSGIYACGEPSNVKTLGYSLYRNDDTHFKTYRIETDGFINVLEEMFCIVED